MTLAIIGVTGMVGKTMLKVLLERNFPYTKLIFVASEKSVGKQINFNNQSHKVVSLNAALKMTPDLALFSAGAETSIEWAPKFAKLGCFVIDNSSAWRMDSMIKVIVPEINGNIIN